MKARTRLRCGCCHLAIEIGCQYTRVFGVPWHTQCAIDYQSSRRAIAASLR